MPATAEEEDIRQSIAEREAESVKGFDCTAKPALEDLAHLYAMYNTRIYCLCLRMTGNPDDAEDLSQEAFLRLIQKIDKFRGESAFYTWLRRLAINVVLLKFQKASWRHEVSLEELTDPVMDRRPDQFLATIDPELVGVIDRVSLERAMDRLPPGFKSVFVLHDIEGYQHTEISKLLGCSIGTSKSQLHKARLKMRELLEEARRESAPQANLGSKSKAKADRIPISDPQGQILQFPRPVAREWRVPLSRTA